MIQSIIKRLLFVLMFTQFMIISSECVNADFIFNGSEELTYIIHLNGKSYIEKTKASFVDDQLSYISEGNYVSPKVWEKGGPHQWDVKILKNGQPYLIQYSVAENVVRWSFDGKGRVCMNGIWDSNTCHDCKQFDTYVTVETNYLIRHVNFVNNEQYIFNLIQLSELPKFKTYIMYFQWVGDEVVQVEAGEFHCKKILFSLKGFKGFFFKSFFYISNDAHRYIVKIDNLPINGTTELIKAIYIPNKKN